MLQLFKICIIYCLRIVLRVFYIFPINERKIIFVSWKGKQYACNPKYIFEYMYNNYKGKYTYIWSLRNKDLLPNIFFNVQICGYLTIKYIYFVLTSKYIITNQAFEPFFPIRSNQILIYTWHGGGAYKRIGDENVYKSRRWSRDILREIRSKMVSYVISSCEKFTSIHSNMWNISKKCFLQIGMPRNDILFSYNKVSIEKVYNFYKIDNTKKIILYAPTFRGDFHSPNYLDYINNLDTKLILNSLKTKYNSDFIFFYRDHYFSNKQHIMTNNIISVSNYSDMQELLCATDILITDYSSSIWDFSFTFKPCLIYAPDLKKYQEDQGFHTPIEEWPFPFAETNEQLIENILHFDQEKYIKAVNKHHVELGSFENGTACEQFYNSVFY